MTVTPSALDVARGAVEADRATQHTSMPAEVVRVHAGDHKRQFVDLQPSLQRRVPNEDGELVLETLPILPMVPVGYIQAGGFFISVPIALGDIVTLHFAERSLDTWIQTAKKGTRRAVDPGDVGLQPLEGAYCTPTGPAPRANLLADVHATNLVIGKDGSVQIHITPAGLILLGSAAGVGLDFLALAQKTMAQLNALKAAITAAAATEAGASGLNGMAALNSALSAWPLPAGVAATKVKAE